MGTYVNYIFVTRSSNNIARDASADMSDKSSASIFSLYLS